MNIDTAEKFKKSRWGLLSALILIPLTARFALMAGDGEERILNEFLLIDEKGRYQNRGEVFKSPGFGMLKEWISTKTERTPKQIIPTLKADLTTFYSRSGLSSIWLGHSTLLIQIDGLRLITDPVFEKKISPVGPTRFRNEYPIAPEDLHDIDAVLLSHNHYDHLNRKSIEILADRTKLFVVPPGLTPILVKWGVEKERIRELNWWDSLELASGHVITAAPAQHFSGRGLLDRNRSLWSGYAVAGPEHRIYFTGDSGYFDGFKAIGDRLGPFDMTFVECGAYNENWASVHMFPEQSLQAHLDLKGNLMHPIHWGSFNLALHDWYDPMRRVTAAAAIHRVSLATPLPGGLTVYGEPVLANAWWEELIGDEAPSADDVPAPALSSMP